MTLSSRIKRLLVGKPIATKHAHHERLPKVFGLPVFASDALSSVAYASEEILLVLVMAGTAAMSFLFPVSLWLAGLMILIAISYYQTIHAYPKGGGTYLVSTENLGSNAGRVAGASLLIDYVLTVAVSISSGVAALVSLYPGTQEYGVAIGVAAVAVLAIANVRGARESGMLFAIPTYTFVLCVILIVGKAVIEGPGTYNVPTATLKVPEEGFHAVTVLLLLRAFAASCTALTGTEAIADGVQAFRPPEARNASATLAMMVFLLLLMFLGISWVAQQEGIVPFSSGDPNFKTVLAQIALRHFGDGWFFSLTQLATALILFLAANTAFADFPRLSSFIARDGFLPRQLMSLGDKLVFQNGILLLAAAAIGLIIVYKANTHSLIPLYAMGVFISFTLSQSGMAMKWWREKAPLWKMGINGFGAVVTAVVSLILLVTKFAEGAWLIAVALTVMLFIFSRIKRYYDHLAVALEVQPDDVLPQPNTTALLLVPRFHKGVLHAVAYAKSMTSDCRALYVTLDPANAEKIKAEWSKFGADMPLVILESPYRSLVEPVTEYIDQAVAEDPNSMITVIVPQAVPRKWWQGIMHSNVATLLKLALASRRNVVVTNVRYFL